MAILDDIIRDQPIRFAIVGSHTSIAAGTVQTLTAPNNANRLMLQCDLGTVGTDGIRFTLDGVDPTSTTGFRIDPGQPPIIIDVNRGITIKVLAFGTSSLEYQWGYDQTVASLL